MKHPWTVAAVVAAVGLLVVTGLFLAYRAATRLVEAQFRSALGPGATIRSLEVTWRGGLSVPAPEGAPVPQLLKADRIWIAPNLRSLFTQTLSIASVEIDRAYLLVRRTPVGLALPVPAGTPGTASPGRAIEIQRLEIPDAMIDWDDSSVTPPVRLRLAPIRITVTALRLPPSGRVTLAVEGQVAGRAPGRLRVAGWTNPHSRDSDLRVQLAGVDLVPLQPYFLGPRDARLTHGVFDLVLDARVPLSSSEPRGS
ncbi:MAG: DUF748 domain-containing protein [Candidatus Rokubacteria bacterium]|nr:DUF748 domain-containing protein [Candidatus Rokubacteria bacterium]